MDDFARFLEPVAVGSSRTDRLARLSVPIDTPASSAICWFVLGAPLDSGNRIILIRFSRPPCRQPLSTPEDGFGDLLLRDVPPSLVATDHEPLDLKPCLSSCAADAVDDRLVGRQRGATARAKPSLGVIAAGLGASEAAGLA